MTDNYLPAAAPPQRGETLPPASADEPGTADVVRDQASDLSHSGVQAGMHVADVAREEALRLLLAGHGFHDRSHCPAAPERTREIGVGSVACFSLAGACSQARG